MSDTSDQLDRASKIEQDERDRRIAAARLAASVPPRPLPTECENCGEPPRERSRYCSDECRDDHAERLERARRQGVR